MELIQNADNKRQLREVQGLIAHLPVVWPTASDCERALADFTRLHHSHRLGLVDALIAATAMGLGAELCTFNTKHYRLVDGLKIVKPYAR